MNRPPREPWELTEAEAAETAADVERRQGFQQALEAARAVPDVETFRGSRASARAQQLALEAAREQLRQREAEAKAKIAGAGVWSAEQLERARAAGAPAWAVAAVTAQQPPAKPKARKRTARQRNRSAFAKSVVERERLERLERESERRGCPDYCPKELEQSTRDLVNRAQRGAAAAERAILRIKRRHYAYGCAIENAAYAVEVMPDGTRRRTRSLVERRARRIVAIGVALLHIADEAVRAGYPLVVEGYSRGTLCSLFINDNRDEPVSIGTLFATMTDGDRRGRWDCGDVVALERAGAFEKWQPSARSMIAAGKACNVGVDRDGNPRALNQYWIREAALFGDAGAADELEGRAAGDFARWLADQPARAAARAAARARAAAARPP